MLGKESANLWADADRLSRGVTTKELGVGRNGGWHMAWITTISEDAATGKLKEIYESFHRQFPKVPNIMQAFSLKPELLAAVARTFMTGTFGASSLSRVQEEMIATTVSSLNHCHY